MQTTFYVTSLPLSVIGLHGVARKGDSDRVHHFANNKNILSITLTDTDRERWPTMFQDAERVWIVYKKEGAR